LAMIKLVTVRVPFGLAAGAVAVAVPRNWASWSQTRPAAVVAADVDLLLQGARHPERRWTRSGSPRTSATWRWLADVFGRPSGAGRRLDAVAEKPPICFRDLVCRVPPVPVEPLVCPVAHAEQGERDQLGVGVIGENPAGLARADG
jgi:hypothetical protein